MAETWLLHQLVEVVSRRPAAPPLTEDELATALAEDPEFVELPPAPGQPETMNVAAPRDLDAGDVLTHLQTVWQGEREILSATPTSTRVLVVERV